MACEQPSHFLGFARKEMLRKRMACDEISFNESWLCVSGCPAVSLLSSIDLAAGHMLGSFIMLLRSRPECARLLLLVETASLHSTSGFMKGSPRRLPARMAGGRPVFAGQGCGKVKTDFGSSGFRRYCREAGIPDQ